MKKIGSLKGKSIVQGDSNIITTNQILYKESEGKVSLFSREGDELVPLTASSINGFLLLQGLKQNDIPLLSILNINDLTFSTPEETIELGFEPFIMRIEVDEYASQFSDGIPVYKVISNCLSQVTLKDNILFNCTLLPNLLYYTRSSDSTKILINNILHSENNIQTGNSQACFLDGITKIAFRIDKLVYNNSIEDFEPMPKYILIFDSEYDN